LSPVAAEVPSLVLLAASSFMTSPVDGILFFDVTTDAGSTVASTLA
jgi:hypothetical protein